MMQPVFVFGSNLAGRHGKGAALFALKNRGAVYGVGRGRQGNSYAIPTKDEKLNPLSLSEIETEIHKFATYASIHVDTYFELTPIGCGLAGNSKRDLWIILARSGITNNVMLSRSWLDK